ncbi:AAA family ATPase [Paenibacillus sp. UNC499MF]|uniref:AAA family ATPase n=1 Tax=Paenibacillus sp. UNC499MF TaxID=1502751 RepID=UPI0008A089B1|nr:AAA family ATPase [Paenibacillus sp. UNC499MF]SEF49456.1 exonuclease SbcC [Paenibacillus sp. UNC499MF]
MRPIRLQISGLQSYRETQEIDFTQLCDAGVFGIFGPTGSGKSSILDALTLALYGKVERASGGTQGIMNHAENTLAVSFTFELSHPAGAVRYRVDRQFKRGSDVSVTNTVSRFVELSGEEPVVLADKSTDVTSRVHQVLGLSMQDFTRAVVLPQGKFAEFLSLTGKDRRQMLQRLFHLEAYGDHLSARVSGRLKEADGLLKQIAAEQQGLGDASEEALAGAAERLKEASGHAAVQRKLFQQASARYEEMKQILSVQKEERQTELELRKTEEEESGIRRREESLKRAEEAEKLRPYVEHAETSAKAEAEHRGRIAQARERSLQAEVKLDTALQASEIARQELADREEPLLIRLEHLNQALEQERQLADLHKQCDGLKASEEQLSAQLSAVKEAFRKEQETKEKALGKQAELKEALKKVEVGYEQRSLLQEAWDAKKELDMQKRQLRELRQESGDRRRTMEAGERELAARAGELTAWTEHFARWLGELGAGRTEARELRKQLAEQEEAAAGLLRVRKREDRERELRNLAGKLAHELHEGQPCPVCGALEHPAPYREAEDEADPASPGAEECESLLRAIREAELAADRHVFGLDSLAKRALEHERAGAHDPQTAVFGAETESADETGHAAAEAVRMLAEAAAGVQAGLELLPEAYLAGSAGRVGRDGSNETSVTAGTAAAESGAAGEEAGISAGEALRQLAGFKRLEAETGRMGRLAAELEAGFQALLKRLKPLEAGMQAAGAELRTQRAALQAEEAKAQALEQSIRGREEAWQRQFGAKGLELDAVEARLKRLNEQERQAEELRGRIEKSIPFIDGVLAKIEQLRTEAAELDKTALQLATKLQGLSQLAAEKAQQLHDRVGDEPVPRQIAAAQAELDVLRGRAGQTRLAHEQARREQQEAAQALSAAEQAAASAAGQLSEALERLERALEASSFADAEAVRGAYVAEAQRAEWSAEARRHREREQTLRSRLAQLREQLAGRTVSEADWTGMLVELREAQERDEAALAVRAKAERDCEELQAKHEQWRRLEERRSAQQTLHGRLAKLQSVLKANAFVEFLAEEQLMQVSRAASQRLGQLTRQRYAIEVDSGGGFVIRDDGSGGVKRPVGTLSGGETFLTSLALALALSAQIQLKGEVPLEFFFLDEGFGTLDQDLLDMVVTSLEKLHMDRLAVGVISHVPELRARLPRKLIVEPAEPSGRGSRVRLELL